MENGAFKAATGQSTKARKAFNARAETVGEKVTFRTARRHHRCLIPASCFYEKSFCIKPNDKDFFWMAGVWDRWTSSDGSELDSCTILTTKPNSLVHPIHNRMPVIIPDGMEEEWMRDRNRIELRQLESLLEGWEPFNWSVESLDNEKGVNQMSLFQVDNTYRIKKLLKGLRKVVVVFFLNK